MTLRDIHVTNVTSSLGSGFATYQMLGDLLIEDSVFEGGSAGSGGAISVESIGGTVTVRGSEFSENSASSVGGAIYLWNVTQDDNDVTIEHCTFADNEAVDGGAIWIGDIPDGTGTEIIDSTFRGNTATDDGGAIAVETATGGFAVLSSTFTGNSAGDSGTSIFLAANQAQASLYNSTIDEAEDTIAAIHISSNDGGFFIAHSTIVAPSALYVGASSEDLLGIDSSIVDVTDATAIVVASGDPVRALYTAFSTDGTSDDIVDEIGNLFSADPQLGPLADNGGPTSTRLPAATSPVIDTGDPTVTVFPEFDQRGDGFARVVNGRVDMGAVERQPALAATGATVPGWALLAALGVLIAGAATFAAGRRRSA